jgi:hypothetical protein
MRTLRIVVCAAFLGLVVPAAQARWQPVDSEVVAEVQREVEQMFGAMAHAVLTQDVEGYLSHIARADREYVAEQTYFAKDFAKPGKATKELSITLDPATLDVGDGSAFATVTFTWLQAQGEEGTEAKERTVSFPARFEHENGSWKYAGEKWHKHEAPGVLVLFDEGLDDAAASAAEAFRGVRGGVEAAFELSTTDFPSRTKAIKLYSSMKHLQQSICLSYEDGLSGWNEPGEALKILPGRNASTPDRFRSLLAHEYGHCATFELGPTSNDMPWWILEGVAELMTEAVNDKARERAMKAAVRWSRAGTLADWNDLADYEKVPDKLSGRVYTQGHAMVAYITETFTSAKRNAWLRALSNGRSLDQATTDVLGMSFSALDAQWRATLPPPEKPQDEPEPQESPAEPAKEGT